MRTTWCGVTATCGDDDFYDYSVGLLELHVIFEHHPPESPVSLHYSIAHAMAMPSGSRNIPMRKRRRSANPQARRSARRLGARHPSPPISGGRESASASLVFASSLLSLGRSWSLGSPSVLISCLGPRPGSLPWLVHCSWHVRELVFYEWNGRRRPLVAPRLSSPVF